MKRQLKIIVKQRKSNESVRYLQINLTMILFESLSVRLKVKYVYHIPKLHAYILACFSLFFSNSQ